MAATSTAAARRLCPPGMIRSACCFEGATKRSCMGRTVAWYWATTDSKDLPPLPHVPLDPPEHPQVGVGVHEHPEVKRLPQLRRRQGQDSLDQDHRPRRDHHGLGPAQMPGEVVQRLLDRLAGRQALEGG